ncbi:hypothetical protein AB0M48_12135 [Lentzea sp. NPDC051208]|uniref:hypothetical protein n=1 Tax=Lentzea sp. NPDC051208 TaxID=3154642 RepID=UPI003443E93F
MVNDAFNYAARDAGVKRELQADGSTLVTYNDGTKVIENAPEVERPDPHWQPDTSSSSPIEWDNKLGLDPSREGPKVPGGVDTPGKGVTTISVDAVIYFGKSVRQLIPEVEKAIAELKGLKPFGPGTFGAAHNFRSKVFGGTENATTLHASTLNVLEDTHSILESICLRCDEIVKSYRTAEELTELDAKEFNSMVSKVKGSVAGMNLGTGG